jgi:3-phenylpropionate/trans-cinnamate dioxygenase ferredoxin subunit
MPEFVKVARVAEIPNGSAICVEIKGLRIALYNRDGTFYATQDYCTHADASLAEGHLDHCEIICPWHGARFDIRTGKGVGELAYSDLAIYPVRVVGADVEIEV